MKKQIIFIGALFSTMLCSLILLTSDMAHAKETIINSTMTKKAGFTTEPKMNLIGVRRYWKWRTIEGQYTNFAAGSNFRSAVNNG